MTALTVTAHLDALSVGLIEQPVMLDGPLAWAAAVLDPDAPPITREHAPEIDLPLDRWELGGTWGWCVSAAQFDVAAHTAVAIRRKPATGQMARYTRDAQHHAGLGPYKARDTLRAATWIPRLAWTVVATDQAAVEGLLAHVTHLGAHRNVGYGHVARWEVTPGADPGGWRDRPLPDPDGTPQGVRPPYYHQSRRVPCVRSVFGPVTPC